MVGPVPERIFNGGVTPYGSNSVSIDCETVVDESMINILESELAGATKECKCTKKDDEELRFDEMMKSSWELAKIIVLKSNCLGK